MEAIVIVSLICITAIIVTVLTTRASNNRLVSTSDKQVFLDKSEAHKDSLLQDMQAVKDRVNKLAFKIDGNALNEL